ncbi:YitT family protein [Anaerovorax odorimutans]|uniref:YitT family protein n=1 Tax=Anaerovorax odorimutans TaxID=109327 RepID=UPI00040345F2|nr:YitT family protein [Anaerovorax odorimutans]
MKSLLGVNFGQLMQILIGVTMLALGLIWFLEPLGMVIGGLTGLAIVIKEVTGYFFGHGVPLYATNIIFNIPLFIIIIKQRGFAFAQRSLIAVIWLSVALWYCQYIPNLFEIGDDLILGAVFGGAFMGSGIGIVLRISATTGGSDTLATILKFKFPSYPIATLIRIIDGIIILSGFFVFGAHKGMYAIIAMIISSYMINFWLSGMHFAKAAFIISNKSQELSEAIIKELGRGVTGIKAKGMYTMNDREMLFVVVMPKQIANLRKVVYKVDKEAFLTIADVKEVLGYGFTQDYNSLGL